MNQSMHSREASLRKQQARRVASRRRHRLAGIFAFILVGALSVGGTVAFLTSSTTTVTNTFTPATVVTDIIEDDFGGVVKENVTIKNLDEETNVPVYIRAKVVVTWANVDDAGNVKSVYGQAPAINTDYTDWTKSVATGWVEYEGYYYWTSPVDPGRSTEVLIDELRATTTPPEGYVLNVEILSEAVQAMPDDAVGEAWGVAISEGAVTEYVPANAA